MRFAARVATFIQRKGLPQASMPRSPHWTVISSRDVLDASPFLKVRVETIELPEGRCVLLSEEVTLLDYLEGLRRALFLTGAALQSAKVN
jgi:hypothetical protein